MRALPLTLVALFLVSCGGKIDDGTDSGVDAGGVDSHVDSSPPPPVCKANYSSCASSSQCCSQVCDPNSGTCIPNVPSCKPDGAPCTSPQQCCSQFCSLNGTCNTPPPPPPPCKPDGSPCGGASECCSNTCNGGTCGVNVACATTSNKQCDMCVAQYCCSQQVSCGNDAACSTWLACVQNCEQQNHSAFTCTSTPYCGPPSTVAEKAVYGCAQQSCSSQCTTD